MAQIRLIPMNRVCKETKTSPPYVRALADSGVIDSFVVAGSNWRAFTRDSIEQIKAHEKRKASSGDEG